MPEAPSNRSWKWLLLLVLIAATAGIAAVMYPRDDDRPPDANAAAPPPKPIGVGCRGRIEPEDGVLVVAAPYFVGRPSLIKDLRVKEGDTVRTGQLIAVLDGWDTSFKAVRQAEADVEVNRKRLAQVQAGAKQADVDALKMEIARWESEYEVAGSEHRRYQKLRENDIISPNDFDKKQLAVDRERRTLESAKERLKSLEEIRKEDVDVRMAELSASVAQTERAAADLERMNVRAPGNGRVLRIHAHPGEEVGPQGILELGKTERMYVVAEVYETDISRVRAGQKADISSDLFTEKLTGTVFQIGTQVTRSELLPLEPSAFADTRVVKVKIKLDDGERVAGLIYGKVDVVIHP